MPPRGRKVDPAVLAQQFQTWKQSQEYSNWTELYRMKQQISKLITTTTKDMTTDIQPFLTRLHMFVGLMKVPRKSHSYQQFHLRTAFFPQVGHDLILRVDGFVFQLQKDSVDLSRDTRQSFVQILNSLRTIQDADQTNFQQVKKDFAKKLTTFQKTYMNHSKKAHDYLSRDVLMVIIRPLYEALDANINFYYLQNRSHQKKKWFKDPPAPFRLRACKERFAQNLTNLIKALIDHGPLKSCPNILKSLSKFEIDTNSHTVLKYFVNPVKNAWRKLRKEMKELFKQGVNRYKQPLVKNKNIVQCLQNLIRAENLAEDLLGDQLKMDQLRFMYDVLQHIDNSPMKLKQLQNLQLIVKVVAPQLATFMALQQMYTVEQDILKKEAQMKQIGIQLQQDLEDQQEPWTIDQEHRYQDIKRLWVWEGYIRDSERTLWVQTSRLVAQLNLMVQEDIIDWLIARHITNKPPQSILKELRPPYVWNSLLMDNRYVNIQEPIFLEEDSPKEEEESGSNFRIFVNPQQNYIDGRVQNVIEKIEMLAQGLQGHIEEAWRRLVVKVTQAFIEDMPESGEEDISFEEQQAAVEEEKKEEVKEEA